MDHMKYLRSLLKSMVVYDCYCDWGCFCENVDDWDDIKNALKEISENWEAYKTQADLEKAVMAIINQYI